MKEGFPDLGDESKHVAVPPGSGNSSAVLQQLTEMDP